MTDTLDAAVIRRGLRTRWLGQTLTLVDQTGSTNDDCRALAQAGAAAGTVVVANWQNAGRGRRGRHWLAPAGTAALLSVVLRPQLPLAAIGRIGMAGAVAVVDAVAQITGLQCALKYPNDVFLDGKKLAGVLAETHLVGERVEWAVLGIGINVRRAAVAPDLAAQATSLEAHGEPPSRNDLIRALLERLEARLEYAERDPETLAAAWRIRDIVLGRRIVIVLGNTRLAGVAADVDVDGRLLLRGDDGTEQWLTPGEVSLHREPR